MTGYLYYSTGLPIIERHYSGPGRYSLEQAEVQLERALEIGEIRLIHMGHGRYHHFECMAVDDTHALLQGCVG